MPEHVELYGQPSIIPWLRIVGAAGCNVREEEELGNRETVRQRGDGADQDLLRHHTKTAPGLAKRRRGRVGYCAWVHSRPID